MSIGDEVEAFAHLSHAIAEVQRTGGLPVAVIDALVDAIELADDEQAERLRVLLRTAVGR